MFSVSASAAPKADTILVGISAAKTGILGPYDLQAGQLFQLRIEQINKAGGVLGKQIKVKWIDTKSDKPTAATNASELISQGAVAILTTCDFDFSFPATQAAGAKKVLGLSLCASSPKAATPAIVGQYGGSMGLGSDTEGVAMAEWFRAHKPALKRAWITKDLSLEYSKATADYFKARWKQLGGTVCGEDTFTAGDNLDLSSNVTRLRGAVSKCDVIYDGSWNPFGAQYVRAVRDAGIKTTIITNASVNGAPGRAEQPEAEQLLRARLRLPQHVLHGQQEPRGREAQRGRSRPSTASRSATTTRSRATSSRTPSWRRSRRPARPTAPSSRPRSTTRA